MTPNDFSRVARGLCAAALVTIGASASLMPAPASAAGFDARAQANASVYTVPGFQSLTPWASSVSDGYEVIGANGRSAASATNAGGTLHGKTVASAAYADLSTGKLGVAGSVTNTLTTPDIGSFAAVTASFADSFRFGSSNGGAFAWNGRSASFDIALEGSSVNTTSRRFTDWSLFINFYSAGTLERPQPEWAGRELGGVQWTGNRLPNGSSQVSPVATAGSIGATASFTGLLDAGTLQLAARFTPGADFDWSMTLLAFPGGLTTELGTQSSDFLRTASVSFAAPSDAVVQSVSGVFPGVSPVPEPATWASMALGLALLAARHRRRTDR